MAGVDNIIDSETPDPNSGAYNTPLIVAACGTDTAAYAAATYVWPNGQTDGFLPNKEELNLIILQGLANFNVFGFDQFWSSTEENAEGAFVHQTDLPSPDGGRKDWEFKVLAVWAY